VKNDEVPEPEPEKIKIPIKDYLTFAVSSVIMLVFFVALLWLALSMNGYL
tara:strand:- start:177 stop:326 length:150 start_codon:yes stop_codon:yes gene_type:complete